jgi:hypothetical protein
MNAAETRISLLQPDSTARPYRRLPLNRIFDLIDQAMEDMRVAGRAGDKGAYIRAEDAFDALHDEWDARDRERKR